MTQPALKGCHMAWALLQAWLSSSISWNSEATVAGACLLTLVIQLPTCRHICKSRNCPALLSTETSTLRINQFVTYPSIFSTTLVGSWMVRSHNLNNGNVHYMLSHLHIILPLLVSFPALDQPHSYCATFHEFNQH